MLDVPLLLFAATLLLLLALLFLLHRISRLQQELGDLSFRKSSQSVRYGKMTEQFLPFLDDFPYNPETFRFLGSPVDGVVFDNDKIVFVEFKTASSRLNDNQKRVRDQIKRKAVDWLEYRIDAE